MDNTLINNKKATNEFRDDLLQMLRIGKWIDRYYEESNQDTDIYIKKFKTLIDSFNKKYKNMKMRFGKKTGHIQLKIYLNEKSVKECFTNSASKIMGVQSIGASKFGAAAVSSAEAFSNELENAKDKLYITYYNPQSGTTNIFLQYDKKEKKVQLVYDIEDIEIEINPEFQLTKYYALNQDYNKKINLNEDGATLGFTTLVGSDEKAEWIRKYDRHISE